MTKTCIGPRLVLTGRTAAELMTANPVSIGAEATVRDAAALLTDREIGAAPVIDEAGRPIGVVSRTDIVRWSREHTVHCPPADVREAMDIERHNEGFHVEVPETTTVREIMTPTVVSVPEDASAQEVVAKMLALKVHRVFVVDQVGVLVGVISSFDILRHLRPEG
ncbi:MAG: hypothetical protein C4297_07490 [Gemmataceae bacterium]